MFDLSKVFFGFADADTEAINFPRAFKEVFFDPHDYINELLYTNKFIIRGRKGDGKTAYSAKLKLSASDYNIHVYQRSLSNFNNTTFSQIKTYDNIGGNPYISFWKCILMIECAGMIHSFEPNVQVTQFVDIVNALSNYGLLTIDDDIAITVSKLVETNTSIEFTKILKHNRKYNKIEMLHGAEQIFSSIYQSIKSLYFHDKKFVFVVDGLDDILHNTEFKSEVITGLIRAIEEINKRFANTTLSLKIILLIRDDILNLCRDPNLSKILRDSGIRLSWAIQDNLYSSDLISLVSKRIDMVAGYKDSFSDVWNNLFPENIGGRNSLDYVLDNIIYRPRDILQFFLEAQREYESGKKFTPEKLQTILANYSHDYFIDAMQDELTGFFPNEVITILPDILSKMGSKYFYLIDFQMESKNYPCCERIAVKEVLEKLFTAGYIGQHRPREAGERTVFSYRNPREKFLDEDECILHRGLMRALNI